MKYKVGNKVRIKSLDWFNANSSIWGVIYFDYAPAFTKSMKKYCGKVMTIAEIENGVYRMKEDNSVFDWVDDMIEGIVEDSPDKETKTFYFVRKPDHMIECSDCLPSGEIAKEIESIYSNIN